MTWFDSLTLRVEAVKQRWDGCVWGGGGGGRNRPRMSVFVARKPPHVTFFFLYFFSFPFFFKAGFAPDAGATFLFPARPEK